MPIPSDLHFNSILTSASVCAVNKNQKYVHGRVSPTLPVSNLSDNYMSYELANWYRSQMQKRAPGTTAAQADISYNFDNTYKCEQYALLVRISDEVRKNADSIIKLDKDYTEFLTMQMLLFKEKQAADYYFKSGTWGTEFQGITGNLEPNQFIQFDQADSTPIEFISNLLDDMEEKTGGFRPNSLTMSRRVFTAIKNNPEIVDRVKYNGGTKDGASYVTPKAIAALLEIDEINVMSATENIKAESANKATELKFINNNSMLLQYKANPATNVAMATACRTFQWTGLTGAKNGHRILKYRDNNSNHSDIIEIQSCFTNEITCKDFGVLLTNCISEAA
ncbi:hypothetical protein PsalMR5_04887 (plasmid) [Piscirickettsia salmonis]|uniref:hypothetical protein n=2 Tax=Piscirickettsia salmonis TaxID=1238 RepID=UPI0018ACC1AB|nr:hypothetical protein [Piscirickettsia salmonis]QGP57368.1 hypothetical protein PsalSR1_04857 [Piscirickettsia salmonis]QGP66962.1 hypothetical protein PsalMR5_04887 [Piscirickettsia salmonis]